MSQDTIAIFWFRSDLRIQDNLALLEAVNTKAAIIPVFIWAPEEETPWSPGAASQWWLHHSLDALTRKISELGSRLIIRQGESFECLEKLIEEIKPKYVFWNRCYEPAIIKRDKKIKTALLEKGISAKSFNAKLLVEPWTIKNKQGQPYKVFTPYWNEVRRQDLRIKESKKITSLKSPSRWPKSLKLKDLKLLPSIPWDAGFQDEWKPGELGAMNALKSFKKQSLFDYEKNRDLPNMTRATSGLSAHLHFGEISPQQVWRVISSSPKSESFLRQIVWREFAHHLLYHFPKTHLSNLREQFDSFPWKRNSKYLKAWQKGMTGYPIVDAGMRQLWKIGWMHNRVRMITASFLVKHLLIPWQEGAKWFWDTLVDADLANNTMGWQWVAGSGADAAPYFRIFNPIIQATKFDPQSEYIKTWVPEISALPNKWISQPWAAPKDVLDKADVVLGKTYPMPIVDHQYARKLALLSYDKMTVKKS